MSGPSVKKNLVYQMAYQILTMLIPLISAPYISRVLGASGVGIYSYTFSIASYFVLAAKLGIHVYGNRSIAAVRDDKDKLNQTFSDLLALHISFSILVMLCYLIFAFRYQSDYRTILLIQSLYVVGEMFEVNWLFFGLEKFKITVARNSIVKIATLIAIFLFVKEPSDIWVYCAIMALGTAFSETIVWIFVPKYVTLVKPNVRAALGHFLPLISFFVPSIAVSLYKVMDKIMLGTISGATQVGYFENSEKIISMTLGLVTALGTVMMPRMANLISKGDIKKSKQLIDTSMKYIILITVAMAFGIAGVAPVFAPVFFGEEFSAIDVLITGLAITMPFTAFANVLRTQYLIPNKHDLAFQGSVISGAVINIIINLLLIPRLQAEGAVIGTIAAEVIVCVIQAFYLRKALPIAKYIKDSIPYVLYGLTMFLCVRIVGNYMGASIWTLIVQVIIGIIVYMILVGGYLYYRKDQIWLTFKKISKGSNR